MFEWHDYKGGTLPEGTTHVQLINGDIVMPEPHLVYTGAVYRYYGPAPAPVANAAAPIPPILPEDYSGVAQQCCDAILRGALVTVTHPEGYERCGLGVPFKRGQPTGGLTHQYRPLVLLEWLDAQAVKSY